MRFLSIPFIAAGFAFLIALAGLSSKRRSIATWCFFAGMITLGVDSTVSGLSTRAGDVSETLRWLTLGFIVKSLVPAPWLAFSLTYSRGDDSHTQSVWKFAGGVLVILPMIASIGLGRNLFEVLPSGSADDPFVVHYGAAAKGITALLLVAVVWILMNLEQTLRSAVGMARWRIKFIVLGLVVIFGARVYVRSQALVLSTYDLRWAGIESSAILIGCVFLGIGQLRAGLAGINLYPSRAVLQSSITVLIVGTYLFTVGVIANIVKGIGGEEYFQLAAFIALMGMAGATLLLLSDRLRQRIRQFVSHHFSRAQHDSARIWTEFSGRLAKVREQSDLCAVSANLISETFAVLSVSVWVADEQNGAYFAVFSSAPTGQGAAVAPSGVPAGVSMRSSPFEIERIDEPWAAEFRDLNPTRFPNGGHRWCVPLRAGDQNYGAIVLADRVNAALYTSEELHLLQCIADQVTSVLLNLRLGGEVARAREMEAVRTMSAFFVHDLKNTASSLNLMLKNAQAHFDDPAFRADALRGLGNAARRIDEMIGRLTAVRQRPTLNAVEANLNEVVTDVLDGLDGTPNVEFKRELHAIPNVLVDLGQIRSVVTNLVLNAREAIASDGRIRISTEHHGSTVVLSVADNGCGMTLDFVRQSLFRPFQSTKKTGLGIGLFQSRTIVEGHGGAIRVESETGKGSTFRVSLPAVNGK